MPLLSTTCQLSYFFNYIGLLKHIHKNNDFICIQRRTHAFVKIMEYEFILVEPGTLLGTTTNWNYSYDWMINLPFFIFFSGCSQLYIL